MAEVLRETAERRKYIAEQHYETTERRKNIAEELLEKAEEQKYMPEELRETAERRKYIAEKGIDRYYIVKMQYLEQSEQYYNEKPYIIIMMTIYNSLMTIYIQDKMENPATIYVIL